MRRGMDDHNVAKIKFMDGRKGYRWFPELKELLMLPKEGHEQYADEWRELVYTGTRDEYGYRIYHQIP